MLLFILRLVLIYLGLVLGVKLVRSAAAGYRGNRGARPSRHVGGSGRKTEPLPEDEIVDAKWEELD